MKTPAALQALIDDGVIDEVLRPLKSGKEAAVYVVRSGEDVRCAKVYKDMAQREFQQHFPRPGWVEHDPLEIWQTQLATAREVLQEPNFERRTLRGG